MSRTRAVAGGGRAVEVEPERLTGWFARFAGQHGGIAHTSTSPESVVLTAADGTRAEVTVPFAPLPGEHGEHRGAGVDGLVAHVSATRRIGLLLVRLGGHSIGIAENGRVLASTSDSRLVHGRTSAGGWSQQRFARRRAGQARQALQAASADAARFLLPRAGELDALQLGGDRAALDIVLADPRLSALRALAQPRVLDVPQPRRAVLDEAAARARCVEVIVHEPPGIRPDQGPVSGLTS